MPDLPPNETPIRAVVFDIGNVLLEWSPERFYDAQIGGKKRRKLFEKVPLDKMNARVDAGASLDAEVEALAAKKPKWADEIRMWRDNWLEMATPAIDRSVRLLHALKARGVPVFALSNFGTEPFEVARKAYPFLDDFDKRWISGHLGAMKPDPEIYAQLEAECGVAPQALLFTDDRPENIEAAGARGWHTHLFDGPSGFAARLVAEGLLKKKEAA